MSALDQWAAQVRQAGGVVTNWPLDADTTAALWPDVSLTTATDGAGRVTVQDPAARYPVATYVALFNAGRIDPALPQTTSSSNAFAYVLAPVPVRADAASQTAYNPATDPANPIPDWARGITNFISDLESQLGAVAKWALVGGAAWLAITAVARTHGRRGA